MSCLSEGIFPSSFKQTIVHLLLKKPSLSDDDLNNFRPISNLQNFQESCCLSYPVLTYCLTSLSSSYQSAYCMFHSTENTLLSIHNDLILAIDRGEVTSLILLDLSAAFDILSIIPSFFIIFKIGLVFMALLLTGFHLHRTSRSFTFSPIEWYLVLDTGHHKFINIIHISYF